MTGGRGAAPAPQMPQNLGTDFGLAPKTVLAARKEPDHFEEITFGSLRVLLYARKLNLKYGPPCWVVVVELPAQNRITVAVKVYEPILEPEDVTPLSMLRRLSERFGFDLRLPDGTLARTFVQRTLSEVNTSGGLPLEIAHPDLLKDHRLYEGVYTNPAGNGAYDCALAFTVDLSAYYDWVRSNGGAHTVV
jgi:hypothetical protein